MSVLFSPIIDSLFRHHEDLHCLAVGVMVQAVEVLGGAPVVLVAVAVLLVVVVVFLEHQYCSH